MKGLWLFASLSAAAAGCVCVCVCVCVTLPFALSELACDIRYMCLCVCGFENEMNYLT